MTELRVLKAADLSAVPWKNGGGVTREIAAWPEGSGIDDFAWRVSLADVSADGPFSAFPGVDRTLTVVEGAGMDLTVGGRQHLVDVRDAPHRFPGDIPTEGRLIDGPVVNLNVMHRRGRDTAVLVSVVRGGLPLLVPAGSTVLVVALDTPARLVSERVILDRHDVAVATGWLGILETEGRAAVITIRCP
ncbi:HutD family protein [Streptomyces sp. H27-C3]|uniref:HutD/Ves family protein n=1 Tax=Streptomyces sp. H27-C3 TaxID=3046305 RepID=UPI0024BBC542|nr:HutD family protein [Streptomyces sp. H27-C3]MDJ0461251.1 HutD family protein [Streptomyces sp. H27-C3]